MPKFELDLQPSGVVHLNLVADEGVRFIGTIVSGEQETFLKAIEEICEEAVEKDYEEIYNEGYRDGTREAEVTSEDSYDEGYDEGYKDGVAQPKEQ